MAARSFNPAATLPDNPNAEEALDAYLKKAFHQTGTQVRRCPALSEPAT